MSKQQAAARAIDAGTVAAQVVNDYGIGSREAYQALKTAADAATDATDAGCTKADFDAEHGRRR